jgi:cysteine desulfurase/selenocysteine lyase
VGDENTTNFEKEIIKKITKKTKVISFSNASNLLGYTIKCEKIVKAARKINKDIIVIIDGTQSAPHQKNDMQKMDVDFFACSAHKMCGPNGIGMLYGKTKYLEKMIPMKIGGGGISTIENEKINYSPLPNRLESGTPNCEGIIGFGAAIDFINKIGIENIEKHDKELKEYFDLKISRIENIEYASRNSSAPVCSFNFKDVNPQDVSHYLGRKHIITRGGLACAKMSYKITNNKAGFVRASFYLYNEKKDINILIKALSKFTKEDIVI